MARARLDLALLLLGRADTLVSKVMVLDLLHGFGRVVLIGRVLSLSRLDLAVSDALRDQAIITDCLGRSSGRICRTRAGAQQEWERE